MLLLLTMNDLVTYFQKPSRLKCPKLPKNVQPTEEYKQQTRDSSDLVSMMIYT